MANSRVIETATLGNYEVTLQVVEDEDGDFYLRICTRELGVDDTIISYFDIYQEEFTELATGVGQMINAARERQIFKDITGEPTEPIIIALTKEWHAKYPAFTFAIWRVDANTLKLRVESRDDDYARHVYIEDHKNGHNHARTVALPKMTGQLYLDWQHQNDVEGKSSAAN